MSSPYKLIYFDMKGRAELSRLVFAAANIEYEDCRIKGADWPALKPTMPFTQLPVLEINGNKYAQSMAIASYLATEFGFYGKDNLDRLQIDGILELVKDFIFYLNKSFQEPDKDKKAEYLKEAIEVHSMKFFNTFESMIQKSTTGFFVGPKLSLADLAVFDIIDWVMERRPTMLDEFPHLKSFNDKISSINNISEYLEKRKK